MLDDILQKKNLHLSYADGVAMPDNYIARYDAVEPKKAQKMIETAASRIDEAAQSITQRKLKPVKRKAKLLGKMVSRLTLYRDISGYDKKFEADSKCVGCGLCSQICPVANIKLGKSIRFGNTTVNDAWHVFIGVPAKQSSMVKKRLSDPDTIIQALRLRILSREIEGFFSS